MQLVNRRSGLRLLRRDKDDSGLVWWAMMMGSRERTRHQLLTPVNLIGRREEDREGELRRVETTRIGLENDYIELSEIQACD